MCVYCAYCCCCIRSRAPPYPLSHPGRSTLQAGGQSRPAGTRIRRSISTVHNLHRKMMWVVSRFCSKLMGRLKLTVHQCTVHTHMPSSQRTCGRFCARDLVCVSVFVVWFSYINFIFFYLFCFVFLLPVAVHFVPSSV